MVRPGWAGQSDILTDDILAMLAAGCPQLVTFDGDLKSQCCTFEGILENKVTGAGFLAVVKGCPNVDVERRSPRVKSKSQSMAREHLLQAIAAAVQQPAREQPAQLGLLVAAVAFGSQMGCPWRM